MVGTVDGTVILDMSVNSVLKSRVEHLEKLKKPRPLLLTIINVLYAYGIMQACKDTVLD